MFTPGERLPSSELASRHSRCRDFLRSRLPEAGGLLVTGRPAMYYFTGTLAGGLFWLPLEGEPVLAARKGLERAKLESPLERIAAYRSFKELPTLCADMGSPLSRVFAADRMGLTWEQGLALSAALSGHEILAGDGVAARTRAVKSEWELAKLREAGKRQARAMRHMLPERIRPGLSERRIAHILWECFFSLGHCGPTPTGMPGADLFLGNVSAGENGNYPCDYNGPLGVKGEHPAAPVMGHADALWLPGSILALDVGFNHEGYLTDNTELYFAGREAELPGTVRRAQEVCLAVESLAASMLRPGTAPSAIYAESLRFAAKEGFAEGFMGLGGNKVPFLGHGIGLTVSEWPIIAGRFDEPLEKGMVIALEPKIGLPGIGMAGTEHTYEITEKGAKCLTGLERGIICI